MNLKENTVPERLLNGLIKENPTFVLMLGMCPTLAVTTSAINGVGMGLTTMAVLALSNMLISLLRGIIPDKVRIPAYIVVIATFVTVVELLLKAYLPFLYDALGLYIPLIVVNCIILGRAEAYASKYKVVLSIFDGIGMGLGFTVALTVIGAIREVLGAGELFGLRVMPVSYVPNSIFVLAPGAFLVLACLTAIQNRVKRLGERKGKDMSRIQSGCSTDCLNCGETGCSRRVFGGDRAEDTLEIIEITEADDLVAETIPLEKKDSITEAVSPERNDSITEAVSPERNDSIAKTVSPEANDSITETISPEKNDATVEMASFEEKRPVTDGISSERNATEPEIIVERMADTVITGIVEGPTSVFVASNVEKSEIGAEVKSDAETEIDLEEKVKTEPKTNPETKANMKVKADVKAKVNTKPKAGAKPKVGPKADTKPKTSTKAKSDLKAEPVTESKDDHEKEERRDD